MKNLRGMLKQTVAFRAFLLRRITRYMVGECLYLGATRVPFAIVKRGLLQAALRFNPMHVPAALELAQLLTARHDPRAAEAFGAAQGVIENRSRVSASDLALTRVPERIVRRLTRGAERAREHDRWLYETYCRLAQSGAQGAVETPESLTEGASPVPSVIEQWLGIDAEWAQGRASEALARAMPLIERGDFVAPRDALIWAERALEHGAWDTAECCLNRAQEWIPDDACFWKLRGALAKAHGDKECALVYWERAASLNPEDKAIFLARQNLARTSPLKESSTVTIRVQSPATMEPGARSQVECVLQDAVGEWQVEVLAPAGWGIVAEPRTQRTEGQTCAFELRACRPDRVRGEAWIVRFVATNEKEYALAQVQIAVTDPERGKVLLVVTEDHELWEERGVISRAEAEALLVEKSRTAAERFAPWTHMVEVGSALGLLDWAAGQAEGWRETRERVREHLAAEVKNGNDVQPHLHAFNLPSSPDFPYRVEADRIVADKKFLLTAEEQRRDFARAFEPQERMAAVARAVAELERLAHTANPNWRAVLWRSGQLEIGDTEAERAWSSVALARAGLFADSDVPKETFPWESIPRTSFFATYDKPLEPRAGAAKAGDAPQILQLPVTSNLEGDFLSDARTLCEAAKRTGEALADKPGVHVITLLTHDKFINARRGADEFCLDENYNEWQTIRAHLDAWQEAGAERVTAREAIEALLDDGSWRLVAMLSEETWLSEARVRYTMQLFGRGIVVSEEYPQWVLVTIPPFLRGQVCSVQARQGERILVCEKNSTGHFWVRLDARTPDVYCEFGLDGTL